MRWMVGRPDHASRYVLGFVRSEEPAASDPINGESIVPCRSITEPMHIYNPAYS